MDTNFYEECAASVFSITSSEDEQAYSRKFIEICQIISYQLPEDHAAFKTQRHGDK